MAVQAKTGRKTHVKGVTTDKRQAEVKALYDELDKWKAEQDPRLIAQILARFGDGYSERNALLIAMQRPQATDVDSRMAWLERGRVPVGKNTAIKIVRPGVKWYTDDPDNPGRKIEHVNYYAWAGIFDVATTIELDPAHAQKMLTDRDYTAPEVLAWREAHPDGTW